MSPIEFRLLTKKKYAWNILIYFKFFPIIANTKTPVDYCRQNYSTHKNIFITYYHQLCFAY